MPITIKSPETDDELRQYYSLRFRMLREPWGEPEGSEKDGMEDECFHVIAKQDDTVIGVGRLQFRDSDFWQEIAQNFNALLDRGQIIEPADSTGDRAQTKPDES